jgi:hypothetical protein
MMKVVDLRPGDLVLDVEENATCAWLVIANSGDDTVKCVFWLPMWGFDEVCGPCHCGFYGTVKCPRYWTVVRDGKNIW